MMQIEDFKKGINNSLKEIEKNMGQQVEAFKEETQKFLKEIQENINKQVEELNKNIQDLKNGNRNNKEITKGDTSGDRKPRKEIRRHRGKYHQQTTRDGREKSQGQKIP